MAGPFHLAPQSASGFNRGLKTVQIGAVAATDITDQGDIFHETS
jgi:hypothetical protein